MIKLLDKINIYVLRCLVGTYKGSAMQYIWALWCYKAMVVSTDQLSKMLHLTLGPIVIGGIESLMESRFGLFSSVDD